MSPVPPLRPALVVNRLFMQEFLAAEAPCFALGIVEERQRLCGMLALRVDQEMPVTVANGGFEFGHALFGTTAFVVLHLVFAFPEFQTYNVLINPHNPLVQAVLRTMLDDGDYFCPEYPGSDHGVPGGHRGRRLGRPARQPYASAAGHHDGGAQQALTSFAAHPDPAGIPLPWVCRESVTAVDLTTHRMALTPV